MRSRNSAGAAIGVAMLLALGGCAPTIVSDTPLRIGRPYQVRGVTYVPAVQPEYDRLGYASWYGREHGQHRTSNGERYSPARVSAAHTTLPLPSYVEVTSLETGRTILVRVNDRGPFSGGRIIDLSRGAAEQLGIRAQGRAAVRVRCVTPSARDALRLRKGKPAAERPAATAETLAMLRARLAGVGSYGAPARPQLSVPPPPPPPAESFPMPPPQAEPPPEPAPPPAPEETGPS